MATEDFRNDVYERWFDPKMRDVPSIFEAPNDIFLSCALFLVLGNFHIPSLIPRQSPGLGRGPCWSLSIKKRGDSSRNEGMGKTNIAVAHTYIYI